ncbi:ArnT family glycosyltransferase [Pedobacter antarcticus]|uniref:ArnT family glycosyltransferase n=1 Tax=Pedobacter antarcticus TaxID=34086 RepID=UPI00292D8380|nr:glycosyltransferase family 39 protein [Pedobacter antarcticus]
MELIDSRQQKSWLYLFIGLAVLLNFSGMFVPVMGPDGALYASIAKNMVLNDNFSDLMVQGKDWLDKPHFPFWMTALSFKVFGIHTWSYKLPGILFILVAALYTYKLAKVLYNESTALWAVLILLTAQHILICTMDIRAEPFLTGLIIASVYHFYRCLGREWILHLLLASLFAGYAVMTKGIFALIPVAGAIGGHLIITKNWKMVFNFRWLLAVVLILLVMLPELLSLYAQFDLHPEKTVFGKQDVSGLKFFFWDSQFGRFFNTGPIKKTSGDPSFFLHTILWAFLPWSLLWYGAVFRFFKRNFSKPSGAEWLCISGSLLTLLIFSVSKFQLPFYITIVFPFFAIQVADYIDSLNSESKFKNWRIVQLVVGMLMLVIVAVLQFFFKPETLGVWNGLFILGALVLLVIVSVTGMEYRNKLILQLCSIAIAVNLYFNLVYYPKLLTYQADSEAAFWINRHNPDGIPVVQSRIGFGFALEFYTRAPVYFFRRDEPEALPKLPYLFYGDKSAVDDLAEAGVPMQRLKTFESYRISRLKSKFLNEKTRKQTLDTTEVVLIYGNIKN